MVSPSSIYTTLANLERKGWIKCIRTKQGRTYTLTPDGIKVTDNMDRTIQEIKRFVDKLLSP
jgi:DNA-binding PadR family transcriptional regulator